MTGKMGLTPEICDAGDLMRILKNPQSHAKGFALVASVQGDFAHPVAGKNR